MKTDGFIFQMFSTDNKSPSWFRVMFTPIAIGALFVMIWGAIIRQEGMCAIGAGLLTAIGGFKALQKKSEA